MKIAVLSGKGGTGKTFISTNLANCKNNSTYIDCDIEEPNGHLFFNSKIIKEENVNILLPKIDINKCTNCKKCANFCKFNAIAFPNKNPIIFKNICHSCGGCKLVCKNNAITEYEHSIGKIIYRKYNNTNIKSGILNIGETSGIPIIKKLLENTDNNDNLYILDSPPGSDCSVIETVSNSDYCLIVAEPTLFGLSNFKMVYELAKKLNKPIGVIINKFIDINNPMDEYCKNNNISILTHIPYDKKIANKISNGLLVSNDDKNFKEIFLNIIKSIKEVI